MSHLLLSALYLPAPKDHRVAADAGAEAVGVGFCKFLQVWFFFVFVFVLLSSVFFYSGQRASVSGAKAILSPKMRPRPRIPILRWWG